MNSTATVFGRSIEYFYLSRTRSQTKQLLEEAIHPLQPLWNKYFANEHDDVLTAANEALTKVNAADCLHVSGLSLLSLGRIGEAIPRLRASIALTPHQHYFANASISTLNASAPVEALEFAQDGLRYYATDPTLLFAAANAMMAAGQLGEALAKYQEVLRIKPDMADAQMNMGNCYRRMNNPEAALTCYDAVLTTQPSNGGVLINRVGTLMEMRDYDAAKAMLEQILPQADIPEVSFMLAMILLTRGEYERGWSLYRRRWDCGMAAPDRALMTKPILPSLADAADKHVLIAHEQGFGDSLQFIRYASMTADRVGRVSVLVPAALKRLFERIDPRLTIVTERSEADPFDFEIPMIEQPFLHGTTLQTIPDQIPYLSVPEDMVQAWRSTLSGLPGKRIGLVWAGQMRPNPDLAAVDRRRSLNLDSLGQLLTIPNVSLVSLQLGEPSLQAEEAPWVTKVTKPLVGSMDFLETAAVIKNLDLVITVDTAVAHLAAGLGIPTWILSRYDGCWRWLENRDDSPWYPGVVRLFQQTKRYDWTQPIEQLIMATRLFAKT